YTGSEPLVALGFSRVRLYRGGASSLRLRVSQADDGVELLAVDQAGAPVLSIGSLRLGPLELGQLRAGGQGLADDLYGLGWTELPAATGTGRAPAIAILGECDELRALGSTIEQHSDLQALEAALQAGLTVPEVVLAEVPSSDGNPLADAVH